MTRILLNRGKVPQYENLQEIKKIFKQEILPDDVFLGCIIYKVVSTCAYSCGNYYLCAFRGTPVPFGSTPLKSSSVAPANVVMFIALGGGGMPRI